MGFSAPDPPPLPPPPPPAVPEVDEEKLAKERARLAAQRTGRRDLRVDPAIGTGPEPGVGLGIRTD